MDEENLQRWIWTIEHAARKNGADSKSLRSLFATASNYLSWAKTRIRENNPDEARKFLAEAAGYLLAGCLHFNAPLLDGQCLTDRLIEREQRRGAASKN